MKGTNAAKLTTMVNFPMHGFDMSPHLAKGENGGGGSSSSSVGSSMGLVDSKYDLYAVCYHQGNTLETGHYTAACLNPYDQQWYRFDDQRVSQVAKERVEEEIVNDEAYMLFYQKRKVDSDGSECSGTSSTGSSGEHWISRIAPPPPTQVMMPVNVSKAPKEKELVEVKEEEIPVVLAEEVKEAVSVVEDVVGVPEIIKDGGTGGGGPVPIAEEETMVIEEEEEEVEDVVDKGGEMKSTIEMEPEKKIPEEVIDKAEEVKPEIDCQEMKEEKQNPKVENVIAPVPQEKMKIEIIDQNGTIEKDKISITKDPKLQIVEEDDSIKIKEAVKSVSPAVNNNDDNEIVIVRKSSPIPIQRSSAPLDWSKAFDDRLESSSARHSASLSYSSHAMMMKGRDLDSAVSLLRASSSCSKDTFLFLDHHRHHHHHQHSHRSSNRVTGRSLIDADDVLGATNHSLWVSTI